MLCRSDGPRVGSQLGAGREAARNANPGWIVDPNSLYHPGTGVETNAAGLVSHFTGSGDDADHFTTEYVQQSNGSMEHFNFATHSLGNGAYDLIAIGSSSAAWVGAIINSTADAADHTILSRPAYKAALAGYYESLHNQVVYNPSD